jgi:hypothetical protein
MLSSSKGEVEAVEPPASTAAQQSRRKNSATGIIFGKKTDAADSAGHTAFYTLLKRALLRR